MRCGMGRNVGVGLGLGLVGFGLDLSLDLGRVLSLVLHPTLPCPTYCTNPSSVECSEARWLVTGSASSWLSPVCSDHPQRFCFVGINAVAARVTDFIAFIQPSAHYNNNTSQPFYDPLSGTTQVSRYQKDKPFWISLKQTWWSGRTICKLFALHSRR